MAPSLPDPPTINSTDIDFTNYTSIWGPIPNDRRPSRQPSIIACSIVAWSISLLFVSLRFWTRRRLNILGASDWCIIPALLSAGAVAASAIEQAFRGAGRHSWELDPYGLPALQRASWYGMLFYGMSLSFTRISILLLYRRIFTYNWAKRAIEISLGVVIILGIWFIVSVCTACVPLQAFWQWNLFWEEKVVCLPYQIWWANAAMHLTADLVIMALPMPILSTLKLPKRQKYALVGVFALGFFVCIISILRLIALVDITDITTPDTSYSTADLIYWTAAEINAAIVCACAMTLKPLVQRLFPRLLGGRSGRGRYVDQSLPWITPVSGGSGGRASVRNSFRTSFAGRQTVRTSIHGGGDGHFRSGSGTSGASLGHKRGKSGSSVGGYRLPRVEEREMSGVGGRVQGFYFPDEDILSDYSDIKGGELLDGQRSDSVSTVAAGGIAVVSARDDMDDGDSLLNGHGGVGRGSEGDLAAPPRAHLRLSIHVTRSVHVVKTPSSPVPDGGDDDDGQDEKGLGVGPEGLPSSTFGQRMG